MACGIKLIIFDFDGTLYDFSLIWLRLILREPWHLFRMRADRVVRRELRGMDFGSSRVFEEEYNKRMSKITHLSEEKNSRWYNDTYLKKTMLKVLERKYRIRDGLKDFISRLKEKADMVILSDYPFVTERLMAVGMDQELIGMFTRIYSAQEFGCLKPAKRAFLEIAEKLGVRPEECLVVGDRDDTDGEGARNAGMRYIQISDRKKDKPQKAMSWEEFTGWAEKEFELA